MKTTAAKKTAPKSPEIASLEAQINAFWDAHKVGEPTDTVDALTVKLRGLREAQAQQEATPAAGSIMYSGSGKNRRPFVVGLES